MEVKFYRYLKFYVFSSLCLLFACDKGFEEENIDPNNPTSVPTAYLMSSAQRSLITEIFGMNVTQARDQIAMRYTQMWANTLYTSEDRYEYIDLSFDEIYNRGLADLAEIIRLNSEEETKLGAQLSGSNENQIAISRILKVWTFQVMTDIWGDIPYSESLKGIEIPSPAYDPQSEIYRDLIKELDEATAQIDLDGAGMVGDLIYDGNMEYWKLFAQSLKLRLGMRMSKVAPEEAKESIVEALNSGVFSDNEQNGIFEYLTSSPNNNPWNESFYNGTPTLAVASTMVNTLKSLSDPRLEIYAQKAEEGNDYIGMPYGVTAGEAGSITNKQISLPGLKIVESTNPAIIISYSEVLFIQAEAAAYGWIPGDSESLYKEAITASMQYWGVMPDKIEAYLENPAVKYDANNYLKSIGDQKWIAFYMQGIEAWSEWRRLDYPELQPAPAAVENREIPRRRGYPISETTLNKNNYEAAVTRQGPDVLETRIWWDAN